MTNTGMSVNNCSVSSLGGNQYNVTSEDGKVVRFDIDSVYFGEADEDLTRDEFIELDDNPIHAEALMDFLGK